VPTTLLQKFSVAFTLALIGLFIAGFIVGLAALDATFFPHSRILSTILGVIVWVIFICLILYYLLIQPRVEKMKRTKDEADETMERLIADLVDPPSQRTKEEDASKESTKLMDFMLKSDISKTRYPLDLSYGQWEQQQKWKQRQKEEKKEEWRTLLEQSLLPSLPDALYYVGPLVLAGIVAWGGALFFIVNQGYALLYIGLTILVVGGGGGFIYGFRRPSDEKPHIFSLDKRYVVIAGVLTFGLSILIHFQVGASAISIFFRVLIFILIIIPVLSVAMGFAPFLKAKVYQLTDKDEGKTLGRIGLGLIFFAFLLQLLQPSVDLWH
jgi:hypothetical protein